MDLLVASDNLHMLFNMLPPNLTTLHLLRVSYFEMLEFVEPYVKVSKEAHDTYIQNLAQFASTLLLKGLRIGGSGGCEAWKKPEDRGVGKLLNIVSRELYKSAGLAFQVHRDNLGGIRRLGRRPMPRSWRICRRRIPFESFVTQAK